MTPRAGALALAFWASLGLASPRADGALAAADSRPAVDPLTGLRKTAGWETVRAHCTVCHSARQFLRQRGSRQTWTEIIQWMQRDGGLWPLDAPTQETILAYLVQNNGPQKRHRRAPIAPTLMPKNPYVSAARREYEALRAKGAIPTREETPPAVSSRQKYR